MSGEALIGVILTLCALLLTSFLVVWSRFSIEKIARKKGRSVRQILRERRGGR
jgi:hypothetical protein